MPRDTNSLPIGRANTNPMLDSKLYGVVNTYSYKPLLSVNVISENMSKQW